MMNVTEAKNLLEGMRADQLTSADTTGRYIFIAFDSEDENKFYFNVCAIPNEIERKHADAEVIEQNVASPLWYVDKNTGNVGISWGSPPAE